MRMPSRETIENLRSRYTKGTRVELLHMEDPQAPASGTQGTVWAVDDTGTIFVHWDTGSGLGIVYGEDACKII